MKKTVSSLWKDHKSPIPAVVHGDLAGQTVIVTGANTGIGFEATKHMASMKPGRLILACRNEAKGRLAVDPSFASVTAFVDKFEEDGGRLDILIANAAVGTTVYRVTKDGWEESLQVNTLSTALLCLRLAPAWIVVINSEFHHFASFKNDMYDSPSVECIPVEVQNNSLTTRSSRVGSRYNETKLLVTFFIRSLSDLLKGTGVVVTTVTPGYSYSEPNRDVKGVTRLIVHFLQNIMAHTTEEGSRQLIYAAVGSLENPESLNGLAEVNDHCLGAEGKKRQDQLWGHIIGELVQVDSRLRELLSGPSFCWYWGLTGAEFKSSSTPIIVRWGCYDPSELPMGVDRELL
ncbi:NAD(P)-binding protein [Coprinellus micaceus]|uniref:NAD(P)-binding protein n=1 Tax=Coprinellus micaceus TaxID=71717 RepID=A0A4Y7TIN6_COPMI|nr:NAD(P)-binding protein [Coprinellus micaceus]